MFYIRSAVIVPGRYGCWKVVSPTRARRPTVVDTLESKRYQQQNLPIFVRFVLVVPEVWRVVVE